MPEKIVQLNEEVIKGQIKELVRGSVEETLNELLEAEAEKLTQAAWYERNEQRQGYRSGHYSRNLTTTSGDVTLKMPKATPRNDMKKPHHLPISANCGGGSAYFRCMGKLNQAGKQRLSARIRFASANNIFNFAVCFRRPRYRVFRYRNRPFTTPKTCSTFARTDDFSCSLRFN